MELADRIFKNKKYSDNRLIAYGFKLQGKDFIYRTEILDGQFELIVKISDDKITTQVIELSLGEPFALYRVDGASGSFVGQVRSDAEKVLLDIADKCFYEEVFRAEQTQMCIRHIQEKYGDKLEFLWEKFPDNAIWRRNDNKKWYALLLTVSAKKLGLCGDERLEIIVLRMRPEDKQAIVDGDKILEGYHMNKNSWFSVILDGRVIDEKLQNFIDSSYELAKKSK